MEHTKTRYSRRNADAAVQNVLLRSTESTSMSRKMTPRIQAISGPLEGKVFSLEDDLHIGRGARNQIRLDDPLVSPKHCSLWFEPNAECCVVHDLASEHGTFVNEF